MTEFNKTKELRMSREAVDWIDGLVSRFSEKIYSLAFEKASKTIDKLATVEIAKEAAQTIIDSACDYFSPEQQKGKNET